LGYLSESFGILVSGWAELGTQWETRDADGKSGVDRQQLMWGLRLTARWAGDGSLLERTEPSEDETAVDAGIPVSGGHTQTLP
jgi:hypothetical protein